MPESGLRETIQVGTNITSTTRLLVVLVAAALTGSTTSTVVTVGGWREILEHLPLPVVGANTLLR